MYAREMRRTLERQEGLTVKEDLVTGIVPGGEERDGASPRFLAGHRNDMGDRRRSDIGGGDGFRLGGRNDGLGEGTRLETKSGEGYEGRTVVLTTGTSLAGKIIMGERAYTGGPGGGACGDGDIGVVEAVGVRVGSA